MQGAEQRAIPYLFKLKQSMNVKRLIAKLFGNDEWVEAGQKVARSRYGTAVERVEQEAARGGAAAALARGSGGGEEIPKEGRPSS